MDLSVVIAILGGVSFYMLLVIFIYKSGKENEKHQNAFKEKYGEVSKQIYSLGVISGLEVSPSTVITLRLTNDKLLIHDNGEHVDKPIYTLSLNKITDCSVKIRIENKVMSQSTHRSVVTNTYKTEDKKMAFEYATLTLKYNSGDNDIKTIVFESVTRIYLKNPTSNTEKVVDFSNSIRTILGLEAEDVLFKDHKDTINL